MRYTESIRYRHVTSDLEQIGADNARLLRQAGTGRRINRPADDPSGAVEQLRLRRNITRKADENERLADAGEHLKTTELALDDAISIFQRAKELAIEGASSAHGGVDFDAIATEADHLLKDLVDIGNRQSDGKYIFAGTETGTRPFTTTGDPATAVTYQGDSGERTVSPAGGFEIRYNLPGDEAFQTAQDVFQALLDLRDAAANRDVDALSGSVAGSLENSFAHLVDLRTELGSLATTVGNLVAYNETTTLNHQLRLSEVEDVDLVETLVQLQNTETRRQAALQATARTIQPTLLDFLA